MEEMVTTDQSDLLVCLVSEVTWVLQVLVVLQVLLVQVVLLTLGFTLSSTVNLLLYLNVR